MFRLAWSIQRFSLLSLVVVGLLTVSSQASAGCWNGGIDDCSGKLFGGDNIAKRGESTTFSAGGDDSGCGDTVKIWTSEGCVSRTASDDTGGCGYVSASITVELRTDVVQGCRVDYGFDTTCYGCDPGKEKTFYVLMEQRAVWSAVSTPSYVGQSYSVSAAAYTRGVTDSGSATTADSGSTTTGQGISYSSQTASVCTISGTTVTNVASGTCTIRATAAALTNNLASGYTDYSWTVSKYNQSITITQGAPASIVVGGTFDVTATASSGLGVVITASGGCTVQSGGTGSATIEATSASAACDVYYNQPGNGTYNAAGSLVDTATVTKIDQLITWGTLPNKTYASGGTFTIDPLATVDSGFVVAYDTTTSAVCTLSGLDNDVVNIQSAGTCTLTADQAGNANYNAAATVTRSFTISKADQTITVAAGTPDTSPSGSTFSVSASSSSALDVAITVSGVCSISAGGTNTADITGSGTGTCTIYYNQAGNGNFNAAGQKTETVTISQLQQTITVNPPAPANAFVGDIFTVAATASSTNDVTITVSGGCSIDAGGTNTADIELTSGTVACQVYYDQAGGGGYDPAPQKQNTTTAIRINQTIALDTPPPAAAANGDSFNVVASASSGLDVWIVATGECSLDSPDGLHPDYDPATLYDGLPYNVNSASVTMNSATSSCTLVYLQYGDDDYYPADNLTSIVKDGTAPYLDPSLVVEVPSVVGPEPQYTFATDETGQIVYGGDCSSSNNTGAGVGSNTVTFDKMAQGTYSNCTVAVKDTAGNVSNTLTLASFTVVAGERAYVLPVAQGLEDCSSWADACADIQYAIDLPGVEEVWIGEGIYRPSATLTLKPGLKLIGGFDGNEISAARAAPLMNVTVISGDKDGDDVINSIGVSVNEADINGTNLTRIIDASGLGLEDDDAVVIRGVVLNAASGSLDGAGIYVSGSRVTTEKVQFVLLSGRDGGAVAVTGAGSFSAWASVFYKNTASSEGGAIASFGSDSNSIEIDASAFNMNEAGVTGGAIHHVTGVLTVFNSTFAANSLASATGEGGAIYLGTLASPGVAEIEFSTFYDNYAGTVASPNGRGGAIAVSASASADALIEISNSLVVGNQAATGANIAGMNNISDGGYNIVGYNGISGAVTGAGDSAYDFVGTSITAPTVALSDVVDVALANNGGLTPTVQLAEDSYAIDRIPPESLDCQGVDQRGGFRPQSEGSACDVGALEVDGYCANLKGNVFVTTLFPTGTSSCLGSGTIQINGGYVQPLALMLLVLLWGVRRRH